MTTILSSCRHAKVVLGKLYALWFALYRMGYGSRMTGHGVRGMASTILHELAWVAHLDTLRESPIRPELRVVAG